MNVIQTQHLCPNHLVSSTLELKKPKRPAAHRVLDIVPATMGSSRMVMRRFTNSSRESECHLNDPDPDIHWTSEFDRLFPGRLFMGRRDPSVLRTMKVPTILVGYNVNKWRLLDDCYTTDGETLTFPCGPSGCWDAGFLPEFWERRGISRSLLWCILLL
ncbi:uncharacterized protein PGTG_12416 [Puccinia graminis f. sp. tritici CRL 75-36-700-3]|uniref:Uncharacterized protein n=1 Tax=Puccinia graminis f. sp. tritici (strain CRL 75-36-700-3 / race SCCL) TaxID=418459 RepID=E3KQ85_PUCGT|nr:uncharacterized protein PGTG_12416 [Puccinia graminis f. sp. tritici CRL 75-36-700-3]EFP86460.2 hypothetical protein PGTG_12416 [Puccinia graminis f. sp. tritici CRL 75-36-700-3]